ncbi:hypothetical protein GobsT_30570 [Gemmata obscuriglobus]|uniref:TIGR03067 domain-containing protein n=1 Tax=Gemmata obscuriglobus TaxID=114 RepID=A0A2Z3H5A8_9BACT|nr:TIGR03067 domain-containing protein [Gemmata obscuriglobus]AWM38746.1 TIGR03067 domain-containing protein [Gemmata obscuriglobus]QEG28281.1 hypothetical protein GobsT_30570 [Gemmata obscuriglobus]VTS06097.1 unnamed protein product [Gemmata obscuriglobus UQM 2246]
MKRVILITAALMSGCGEPPAPDAEQVLGEWVVVDFESPTATEDRSQRRKHALVSEGTWSEQFQGDTFEDFEYALDETKSPKHLDLTYTNSDGMRLTVRAIYELSSANRMRVCIGSPPLVLRGGQVQRVESVRPTAFVPKDGPLIVYHRRAPE